MNGFADCCPYQTCVESGSGELTVTVPCRIGFLDVEVRGFLDTGAHFPVVPADIANRAGFDTDGPGLGSSVIDTRLGRYYGHFERASLVLRGNLGNEVTVDVTWLVIPDWHRPIVLGWEGCLEGFRWGIDPADERFHFGPIG